MFYYVLCIIHSVKLLEMSMTVYKTVTRSTHPSLCHEITAPLANLTVCTTIFPKIVSIQLGISIVLVMLQARNKHSCVGLDFFFRLTS